MNSATTLGRERSKARLVRRACDATSADAAAPPKWQLSLTNTATDPPTFTLTLRAGDLSHADFLQVGADVLADIEKVLDADAGLDLGERRRELQAPFREKADRLREELAAIVGEKLLELHRWQIAAGC